MKKSYISILLLFLVMILAISAVSAAEEIDDTSDSALQAVDEAPIEEAASDIDVVQATDDAEVIADAGDGNNFTSLQYLIDNAGSKPVSIDKDYVKASGEDAITISNSVTIMDKTKSHKIDANGVGGIFKIKEKNVTVILIGLTLVNGNSDSGAAINSVGDLLIEDCVFTNNTATGRGGAVYIGDVQETVISNSKFYNNTALSGGAICWDGDNGQLTGSEFEGNKANDAGGAVFWFGDNGYIDDSTFTDNTAANNGGALHWMTQGVGGKNGTLIRSQFINNKAGANGGAVFWNGKDGHVYDTDFNANEAPNAGAVYWAGSEGTIKGGDFKYNKATGNLGGAIYVAAGSLDIESIFQENTALNGGAIALNAKGNIADSIFTDNAATSQGGALFALNTDASVTGSHFIDNSAVAGGKAIYFNNGALALSNNIIEGDDVEIDVINGEVISQINVVILSNDTCSTTTGKYMVTANITDDNNNIIANAEGFKFVTEGADVEAKYNATTKLYEGLLTLPAPGVFTVNASYTDENLIVKTATIQNYKGTFQDLQKQINDAATGSTLDLEYDFAYSPDLDGASYVDGVTIGKLLTINGNGYTISGSNAARIFQVRDAPLTLSNAVLTKGNTSKSGGAILVSYGTLILASVNLTNNTAGLYGGAISYVHALKEDSDITNCIFENNEAVDGSAGAIFFEDTDISFKLTIAGSNFTNNKAGAAAGAIYISDSDYVGIEESNFINNIADEDKGGAVYVGASAMNVNIQNSVFNGNEAVKGNAIYNLGELSLSKNTINTENADIYNDGGAIYTDAKVTTFNATVAYGEKVNLTAIVTDDNDNLIYDSSVYFKIDKKEYNAKYNESTKRYELKDKEFKLATGKYPITMVAEYIQDMNMVETGILTATPKKGTFSDLQYQINALEDGETLDLAYDFTYTAGYDDVKALSTFDLANGVVINKNITINGNAYTISGNNSNRIFFVNYTSKFTLNNATLGDGFNTDYGGAIYIANVGNPLNMGGSLIADHVTFTGNKALVAGAINVQAYGSLYVNECIFEDNEADITNNNAQGGAIKTNYKCDVTIIGSNFTNNVACYQGGAIYLSSASVVNIEGSKFINNSVVRTAMGLGGALYVGTNTISITGSDFINSNATSRGGAIYISVSNANMQITDSTFIGNDAGSEGGAIYQGSTVSTSITGSTFKDNTNNNVANALFINSGKLYLEGNTINSTYAEIYNKGTITSTINAIVLENKTKDVKDMDVTLTAIVSDDKGNLIYDPSIKFNITGEDSPIATTVGYENYTASYTLPHVGAVYEVAMISTKAGETVTSYNGILRNIKGTYTDLQNLIDDAEGNLVLPYDFAYNAEVDGESFPNGVVISQPIVIDGNGSTISGENSYRIFYINASDVELTDIAFVNGSAVTGGAIYYSLINGNLSVSDSVFIDNEATDKGGAIFVWSGLPTIEGSEFYNNIANANGGAICFWRAVGDIDGCYFENNNATRSTGGAVNLAVGGKVTNSVFVDNDAFGTNSALAIGGTNSYVGNCNFTGDYAIQVTGTATLENNKELSAKNVNGYAVYNVGKGLTLIGNKFNSSIMNGKNAKILSEIIVTVLDNKTINTTDDTFELNATITDADGNVIYDKGVLFTVNNESVSDIKYNDTTGLYTATIDISTGIYNVSMTKYDEAYIKTAVIRNFKGTFTDLQNMINNAAEGTTLVLPYNFTYDAEIDGDSLKAGVVIGKHMTVDGNGSTISGADAARIFQLNKNNINIKNTTFINGYSNTSSTKTADWGGAIYSNGAYKGHVISDCKFYNNTAYNGGAIYLGGDASDIIGCEFEDNNATTSGGAVFLYGWADTISDSTFKFNMADELGGAVACYSTEQAVKITNSVFIGNGALKNGGAVSMQNAAGQIIDSNFTGNTAYNGGAVYWGSEGGSISGGEFIENEAFGDLGGAIFAEGTGLTITSTFTENSADNGGAIAVFKDATITESTFTNNTADNYGGAVYVNGSAKLDIRKSAMKNNSATVGSSIYSNGTIGSTIVNATILDNKTWNDTGLGDLYVLNATLTDDMGNSIYDPNFRFTVNGVEIEDAPLYHDETGLYTLGYVVEKAGLNVISTSYNAANLQVFTGALDIPLANVTEFTVFAFDNLEGENTTVFVTLIGVNNIGLDSIVTVIVNNKEYAVLVKNGTGNITIENLTHGQYPVVAMFEDPNYEYTINSTVFNVKGQAVLNITELTTAEYGDVIEITIKLTDSEGNPLSGVVTIDNVIKVLVEEGIGTFVIDNQPDVGKYSFQAVYDGDNDYFGDLAIFNVTVTAKELNQSEVEFYFEGDYDNGLNITITSPVDGNYTVDINGTNVTVEVVNGTGSAIAKLDKPDDYTAVITLNDENYSLEPIEYDVVYKGAPEFTVEISGTYPNAEIRIFGTPGTYHVNIDEFDTINITVSEYGLPGVAPIEGIAAGDYTAIVSYDANDEYRGDYKEVDFTIDKASITEFTVNVESIVEGENATVFITLIGVNDTGLDSIVTVIVDNKEYDVLVINGTGNTTIENLARGQYTVVAMFEDTNYEPAINSTVFYVKAATILTVDSVEANYSDVITLTVKLTDSEGNPLTGIVNVMGEDVFVENGVGTFTIDTQPDVGTYNWTAVYEGNNDYMNSSADFTVTVNVKELTEDDLYVYIHGDAPDNVTVYIEGPVGEYNVTVDGQTVTVIVEYDPEDESSWGEANITGLTPGDKVATITIDDPQYKLAEDVSSVNFTYKGYPEYTVTITGTYPNAEVVIEGTDGNYTVYIDDDHQYVIAVKDGVGNQSVSGLFAGEYEAHVVFEEQDGYHGVDSWVNFTIAKASSNVTIGPIETVVYGTPVVIKYNITNETDFVTISISKLGSDIPEEYVASEGTITANLTAGKYIIRIHNAESDDFNESEDWAEFTVEKAEALTITVDGEIGVMGAATVNVTVADDATGYVVVDNDGVKEVYELVNGSCSFEIYDLQAGEYTINVTYLGDDNYNKTEATKVLDIPKSQVKAEITDVTAEIIGGQDATFTVTMNNTLATGTVSIFVDGVLNQVVDLDEDYANVTVVISGLGNGTHTIAVQYDGDDNYEALENATTTITVAKAASKVTIEEIENVTLGNSVIIKYSIVNETEFVTISISKVGSDIPEEYVEINGTITAQLPVGTYIVSIHNGENAFYTEDEATATFTVEKADDYQFEVNLTVDEIDMGENLTIDIELPEDANGNVTVYVDGVEAVNATVKDGKATVTVPASAFTKAGYNDIDVTYSDDNYAETTVGDEIYVNYVPFDLTASADDIEVGQNATIIVNLPENADGYAYVILQGVTYDVVDGKVVIENLTEGTYTATVTFEDDSVYEDNETTVTFNVTKVKVSPEQAFNITAPENSTSQVISVNLPEDATGYLLVDIDGDKYYAPLVNGSATIQTDSLDAGNHNVTVTYTGDDKYAKASVSKVIPINTIPVDLTASADDIEVGQNATIIVNLPEGVDGVAYVILQGVTYDVVDGKVVIENLTEGTYTATVTFMGNGLYEDNETTVTFNVTKVKVSPEQAFNITAPENSTSQVISVNLPEDATGFLLLDVNGTQTHVPLVDGKANVTVPNLPEGLYNATITYTGDNKYAPITTTKELNVTSNVPENALSIPDSAKSDTPTTYSISLPSDAGGYLEVDVDGTKYAAPLNNGSASVTIPALAPGNHNVTVKYTGDDKYTPVTKATTLNVTDPVYKISNNKNVAALYSAKATYKVLVLRDGKAAGAGEKVTFKFNGKTYTATTDKNGYATLKLNTKVKVKKYTVTATIKGASVKNTVTIKHVIKAKNKKIGKKSKNSKKSKKSKYIKVKVSLKKVNGKYLKGKKITIKFKGKKYKVKTNKKGKATWKLKKSVVKKLKKGKKYKYTVTYGKDKVTKKIKVKK